MVTNERRRLIKRLVAGHRWTADEGLRIESLMDRLRQEVQVTRDEQPDLREYRLYDLTFKFQENGLLLNMEFRK